jgi:hypothetical protein
VIARGEFRVIADMAMRILGQDGGRTERLDSILLAASGGLCFDVLHQGHYTSLSLLLGQPLPARERIESQDLPGGVLETVKVLPAAAGCILLDAVEPGNRCHANLRRTCGGRRRKRLGKIRRRSAAIVFSSLTGDLPGYPLQGTLARVNRLYQDAWYSNATP